MTSAQSPLRYRYTPNLRKTATAESLTVHVSIAQAARLRRARLSELMRRVDALKLEIDLASADRRTCRFQDEVSAGPPAAAARAWNPPWRFTTRIACPWCESPAMHRSHRHGPLERVMSAVALPFRCDDCGARFFVFRLARM